MCKQNSTATNSADPFHVRVVKPYSSNTPIRTAEPSVNTLSLFQGLAGDDKLSTQQLHKSKSDAAAFLEGAKRKREEGTARPKGVRIQTVVLGDVVSSLKRSYLPLSVDMFVLSYELYSHSQRYLDHAQNGMVYFECAVQFRRHSQGWRHCLLNLKPRAWDTR
jgi:hypothetical protein